MTAPANATPSPLAGQTPGRTRRVWPREARHRGVRPQPSGRRNGWLRRVHAVVGLVSGLNLLLLMATGFLLQHRDAFGLDEKVFSRRFLPAGYRAQDGNEGVRADIVVADLHSGRLFGRAGALVLDGLTLGWLVLLGSGVIVYALGRRRIGNGEGVG